MKILLSLAFIICLSASAAPLSLSDRTEELSWSEVENSVYAELTSMTERGWTHLGCISQVNGTSSCLGRAHSRGYSESRIQQDYVCPPKLLYSCYGR